LLEILIIADDLTGAADCGAACAAYGLETVVVLNDSSGIPSAQVVAFDANTRGMTPSRAAAETARIVHEYPARIVYKKIDSTLRGNVGAEIAAALEAYREMGHPEAVAVVAPAFPAMGRTTKGGRMYVRGEAFENRDIGWGLEDAETDEDLRAIAAKWIHHEAGVVWAGSAGLARCLAWWSPDAAGIERGTMRPVPTVTGPIVLAIGSPSQRSREQVEALKEAGLQNDVILTGEAEALAEAIARRQEPIGGLVLTGGETARAVLSRLGIWVLRVVGEVETGVPILIAEGSGLLVVTKAGDFGDRETLLRCRTRAVDRRSTH
jgi:uncharacterized protein YgbK (DUF1537 family)